MRILFISLEFISGTFSGNGIAAQSQARALADVGQHVMVIAASPTITAVELRLQQPTIGTSAEQGSFSLIEVPVTTWGRLDSSAPWQGFQAGMADPHLVQAVLDFAPDVAMVVDWSALPAWQSLLAALGRQLPYVWLNYRVFSRTESGAGYDLVSRLESDAMAGAACTVVLSRSDQEYLIQNVQRQHDDCNTIHGAPEFNGNSRAAHAPSTGRGGAANADVHVLLCALRGDMKQIPMPDDMQLHMQPHTGQRSNTSPDATTAGNATAKSQSGATMVPAETANVVMLSGDAAAGRVGMEPTAACTLSTAGAGMQQCGAAMHPVLTAEHVPGLDTMCVTPAPVRSHITCVVRLAPEKEPHLFVSLMAALEQRGTLKRHGLVPLMVGSTRDEYAQGVKAALRQAVPHAVILEQFMGPGELARVYSCSRLNVHPATYDAFGMTIVEAASQGCPSLVHDGNGAVGATDLLRADQGEVFLVDLKQDMQRVVESVEEVLVTPGRLEAVGRQAAMRARSWDEQAHANTLVQMVVTALEKRKLVE